MFVVLCISVVEVCPHGTFRIIFMQKTGVAYEIIVRMATLFSMSFLSTFNLDFLFITLYKILIAVVALFTT